MNGILVIDKEKQYTSRDVVNVVGKYLDTKKVGHTGTLDPIATGVLVLCVGKALKISELITSYDKEYIAKVKLGIETDTLDITGNVKRTEKVPKLCKEDIINVLNTFKGTIKQQVPLYSAVKVNGRKLYQYAREKKEVELPTREIIIYNIELLDYSSDEFIIKCHVSKGTYIRSLIRDIGYKLNTCATMIELTRIKQGNFSIDDACSLDDIKNNKYKMLSILDVLPNIERVIVVGELLKKVRNGMIVENFFKDDIAFILTIDNKLIGLYKKIDNNKAKPWKMF